MTREDIYRALNEFNPGPPLPGAEWTSKEMIDFALAMVRRAYDECERIVTPHLSHPVSLALHSGCPEKIIKEIRGAKP